MNGDEVAFGSFRLHLVQRQLTHDGTPVQLGSRALGILCALASAKGEVVTKDELMARVWPGVVVEDNAIQVHVSALRKALEEERSGQSYVITAPGRGYRLIGVQAVSTAHAPDTNSRDVLALPERPSIAV